ncbi:MAG: oligosaccharide flippase family protein [Myxococcales bacterium]|nr:oligosaccharide flippase family protein [Myxococcales bacterium]
MNGPSALPLSSAGREEIFLALRNALKLGASLVCTWGIALAVKLLVPRYLGPDTFGKLTFADGFAATFFVALTLGMDLYIRREVSVRLEHAAEFFGGVLALRVAITAALFVAMSAVLHATHRPPQVCALVYLFGVAQFFISVNATLSAILHAAGRVDGMSIIAAVTKVLWAGGCAAAILLGMRLWLFPASVLAGEVVECVVLYALARRHAGLRLRFDWRATWRAISAAFPFYVNAAAYLAYSRLDVSLLAVLANDREVGWYGAAQALSGLTMALTPLLAWVYMPLLARAAGRSREMFYALLRRELEYTLVAAIPLSAAIGLGADLWISLAFGDSFAPAAMALRFLGPMAAVTYVAFVVAACATLLESGWRLTLISLLGLPLNVALNLILIPLGLRTLGPMGGGGAGSALAALGTELFVATAMIWTIGRNAIDRRVVVTAGKLLGVGAAVTMLDLLLGSLTPARRVTLDALAFAGLALLLRAVDIPAIARLVRDALNERRAETGT